LPASDAVTVAETVAPVAVVEVPTAGEFPAVAGVRPDGTRVRRAWLLVRSGVRPVGTLVLDVPVEGLTASQVGAAVRARFPSPPDPLPSTVDLVPPAVVICTRGRPAALARALASLRAQTLAPVRVIVVDSGAEGGPVLAAAREADAEYLPVAAPGLARARNAALRHCPDQPIAWLDDDELADRHWLAEAARALAQRPDADVVCGAIIPAELETPAQVWFEALGGMLVGRGFTEATFGPAGRDFHPFYPRPPVGAGANMVTRPGVAERVGGFHPALGAGTPARGGEDTLFFALVLRAGGTVLYRPSLLTRHFHRREPAQLHMQLHGYGTGLTAMYAALVHRRPATLPSLLALAPRALRDVATPARTGGELAQAVPAPIRHALRRGMLAGPLAYLRGLRALAGSDPDGAAA